MGPNGHDLARVYNGLSALGRCASMDEGLMRRPYIQVEEIMKKTSIPQDSTTVMLGILKVLDLAGLLGETQQDSVTDAFISHVINTYRDINGKTCASD